MQVSYVLRTDGSGLWSNVAKDVWITEFRLDWVNDQGAFGEFIVKFHPDTWNINEDGLIYTDERFIRELRFILGTLGITGWIDYSEQGMQGTDYVSLDVEEAFIHSFCAYTGEDYHDYV